jgi:hypothetical protein
MSKKISAKDVECEFSVSNDGYSVKVRIVSDVPIFKYKNGAQIIVDAVADSAMHYYSISDEDWEKMAENQELDS